MLIGISNIKLLSFVVSEKYVILKICTFSIKNHDFTRKNNFELALHNSVIMLLSPTDKEMVGARVNQMHMRISKALDKDYGC
jgi:hypothetical protein